MSSRKHRNKQTKKKGIQGLCEAVQGWSRENVKYFM